MFSRLMTSNWLQNDVLSTILTNFSLVWTFWPLQCGFGPSKVYINWFISHRRTIKTNLQPAKTYFSRLMTSNWRQNDVLSTILTIFSLLLSFWPLKCGFSPQKVYLNWFISRRRTIKTQMQPTKTCFSRLMTSILRLNDVLSTILTNFSLLRTFWLL